MQAIMEPIFDVAYLVSVITIGIKMIRRSQGKCRQFTVFGWMAVILGAGDSFHLVPRIIALCTTGFGDYTVPLGIGKWITSVTMTIFYVLIYYVWRERYNITEHKNLTVLVYLLAGIRIALCMMPQNQWTVANPPLSWGIYRNSAKEQNDRAFRWMWLTIVLSFGCYLPVVLFAETIPVMGALMIPKTCAYLWAVVIGFRAMKSEMPN